PASQTTAGYYRLNAIATAPGYALSGEMADPNFVTDTEHTLPVQMPRGQTVRGRLLDTAGRPAVGRRGEGIGLQRDRPDGVLVLYHEPPVTIPGWPEAVTTDEKGEFTLRDIGPETQVTFQTHDERFAPQWFRLKTGKEENAQATDFTLPPARVF